MNHHNYNKHKEGIGSLFHEIGDTNLSQKIDITFDYELFYTGRQAFKYILDTISNNQPIEKIWMPAYYCQHVTRWVKKVYPNLFFYNINPFTFDNPIKVNDFASENDVVLINNYWGLSDTVHKTSKGPIVVEDHSHGWLTKNCMHSRADYCFASLRKSLPIPLGGMAWKPEAILEYDSDRYIVEPPFYKAFDTLHDAMKAKTAYKKGAVAIEKSDYLKVIDETEDFLDVNHDIVALRPQDREMLHKYLNVNFLAYKQNNLDVIYKNLIAVDFMKVVKRSNHTTFGLILLFKEESLWRSLRSFLIEHDIYPSFLWPDNTLSEDWQHVLNIHVDFRYNEQDMMYVSSTLNTWMTQIHGKLMSS
jgi:hypothetical protein